MSGFLTAIRFGVYLGRSGGWGVGGKTILEIKLKIFIKGFE